MKSNRQQVLFAVITTKTKPSFETDYLNETTGKNKKREMRQVKDSVRPVDSNDLAPVLL